MTADRKEAQAHRAGHGIKLPVKADQNVHGWPKQVVIDADGQQLHPDTIAAVLNAYLANEGAGLGLGPMELIELRRQTEDAEKHGDPGVSISFDCAHRLLARLIPTNELEEAGMIARVAAARIAELEARLKEANEVLRSAYQIAARRGAETNWPAFMARLESELKAQLTLRASPPAGRE